MQCLIIAISTSITNVAFTVVQSTLVASVVACSTCKIQFNKDRYFIQVYAKVWKLRGYNDFEVYELH